MRELVRRILESEYTVVTANDGSHLLEMVREGTIRLIILDIGLPGEDGIAIAKSIRGISHIPVVFLSGLTSAEFVVTGLNVGGDDYVTKPFEPSVLLARIRNAMRHTSEVPAAAAPPVIEELRLGPCLLDMRRRTLAHNDGRSATLTEMESRILYTLGCSIGLTVSREALSRELYGRDWLPTNRSLDVHLSHIRSKLIEVSGDTLQVTGVRGVGYRMQIVASGEPAPVEAQPPR